MAKSAVRPATAHDLMFDPSILLSPVSFRHLAENGDELKSDQLFVPHAFVTSLYNGRVEPAVAGRFGPELPRGGYDTLQAVDLPELDVAFGKLPEAIVSVWSQLPGWIEEHGIVAYQPSESDLATARETGAFEVGEALRKLYPGTVGEILFEEWIFLQTHSWIASRRKWVFAQFIRAGGVSMEFGRRGYDMALQRASAELPPLVTRKGAKRAARWIGGVVVGVAVERMLPGSNLVEALIAGGAATALSDVAGGASKRVFLLIDP